MAGGYERVRVRASHFGEVFDGLYSNNSQVNAQDDDANSAVDARSLRPIPNSPPPSFHSRASSTSRQRSVDPDLADAFDDDDDSDDEIDDRRRLVRQNSTPDASSSENVSTWEPPSQPPPRPAPASSGSRPRVVGGGVGSDGVFANLSARPERGDPEKEKDELPPVCRL